MWQIVALGQISSVREGAFSGEAVGTRRKERDSKDLDICRNEDEF